MLKRIKCLVARVLHALGVIKCCKAPPLTKEVLEQRAKNIPKATKKTAKKKTTRKV